MIVRRQFSVNLQDCPTAIFSQPTELSEGHFNQPTGLSEGNFQSTYRIVRRPFQSTDRIVRRPFCLGSSCLAVLGGVTGECRSVLSNVETDKERHLQQVATRAWRWEVLLLLPAGCFASSSFLPSIETCRRRVE